MIMIKDDRTMTMMMTMKIIGDWGHGKFVLLFYLTSQCNVTMTPAMNKKIHNWIVAVILFLK